MAVFPHALPKPEQANYTVTIKSGAVRSPVPAAPAEQRSLFNTGPLLIPLEWLFTQAELALFEGFVDSGYGWFRYSLLTPDQSGLHATRIRFVGEYTVRAEGPNLFRVAVQAETAGVGVERTVLP